jgi:nucleotide-binding universal stress UspA family protein
VSTIPVLQSTLPRRSDVAQIERSRVVATPSRGRLLVPTDGSSQPDAAVTIARALARRDGRELVMLPVDEHPARVISRMATRGAYELVVMGLGGHGFAERSLQGETALRTIRWAEIPVLAVAPRATELPGSAVVAMDFSVPAIQAARAACALLGETGTLTLAYVRPGEVALGEPALVGFPDSALVETLFTDLRKALPVPSGISLETVMLSGDPALAILSLAQSREVDLIAAGSHGYSALQRALLGSVSTWLLRHAECSVLVAPSLRRRVM